MEERKELVFLGKDNATPLTDSLIVSKCFGKRHYNVVRDIENLIDGLLKIEDTQDKFFRTTYINEQNKTEYPLYQMTQEGFTLLVMGFTGNEALKFKIKFIKAFKEMAKRLEKLSSDSVPLYEVPQSFSQALMLAARQAEQIEQQQKLLESTKEKIVELNKSVESMKKKVTYLDIILKCPETVLVKTIAQDYGMNAIEFNKMLHDLKIQYKVGDQWILYTKFISEGFVKSVAFTYEKANGQTAVKSNTQWTQKGRMWLYEHLKSRGILPIIEQPDMGL